MLFPRLLTHQTFEAMHVQGNDGQSNSSGKSLSTFRPNAVEATVFKIVNVQNPRSLRPCCKTLFSFLQRGKILEHWPRCKILAHLSKKSWALEQEFLGT